MDREPLEDGSEMVPYCARVDVKLSGNGANPLPLEQPVEHLRLPGSELVQLREAARHGQPRVFVAYAGRPDFGRDATKAHLEFRNPVAQPRRAVLASDGR